MIGKLNEKMLEAMLELIPVEFSVLNAQDFLVAWNRHDGRVFKRPLAALGKNVKQCHPEKSLAKVMRIIEEMKQGTMDEAEFWVDVKEEPGEKRKVLIRYFALRDKNKEYLGCLEATQDVSKIMKLKGEKRLLD